MIVLPLGAATLPNLGRSVGEAQHEFKQGLSEGAVPASDDGEASTTA